MTDKNRNHTPKDRESARRSDSTAKYRNTLNESARLLRANRPGEAVALLEPLQAAFPTDPDLAINLGGALILQRKWTRAVKTLENAAHNAADNVMLWTNLAAAYLGRLETSGPKHQKRAIRAYEKALWIDPRAPNVHYHLGLIYKQQGDLRRASAMFQRALEVNPNDQDARYWMDRLSVMLVEQERNKRTEIQPDEGSPANTAEEGT